MTMAPKRDLRTIAGTLRRCLVLRCPACGRDTIVARPFNIKDRCTACGVIYQREPGFFVGAILANVVTTELVILLVYFGFLLFTNFEDRPVLTILFLVGITFPLAFYHHSWSFWLGLDHLIEGLPGN